MKKLFVTSLVVFFMSVNAQAVEYYDDGLEHDIDTTINDSIEIYNDVPHLPETFTTVNIQSGGSIYGADIFRNSLLNVYSGGWSGEINSHMFSNFNIINGSVDEIDLYDESHGAMSGGTAYEINVWNQSIFSVSGGEVPGFYVGPGYYTAGLSTHDNATVEISGGYVNKINSIGNSTIEITGGMIDDISAYETSLIIVKGLDFNYNYGYITDTSGYLTGTLLSGDFIDVRFDRFDDAQILLVPEPTTLLLVGLGGLVLRKRCK
jgi:hypothetical protein